MDNVSKSLTIPITEIDARSGAGKREKQIVKTTCPYCGVGCGIDVEIEQVEYQSKLVSQLSGVSGTPEHPANFGRLCVKGSKLLETNNLDGRLLHPMIAGEQVSWDDAIQTVANKFKQVIRDHGPGAVAFYVSGQLLTEDYYVANKLMKGYIGGANIDTNSRLCMSSAVAAYKRAFGADTVPCSYEDIELADTVVLVGSNAAWTHPVLFQRIERAKKLNPNFHLCVVDPRKTATCEFADSHLAIKPGTDTALFNGLLNYLIQQHCVDSHFIEQHTQGYDDALEASQAWTPSIVARYCDIELSQLIQFYDKFKDSKKIVTAYSMGVNQSSSGVDKANAIINCHLATGQIGNIGSGPFSLTGQPNAMGGREVGGLANMLAAHMDLDNADHRHWVQEFWQSPRIAEQSGYKAVELFDSMASGKIKAVWIMATNPVVSMPNRDKIIKALQQCETVVVSDCVANNDTLALADIALPATGWSEKDGTVTNSERRISRQRATLPASGEAKHDWQIICDVAKAMGFNAGFNFQSAAQIFSEHASLSGVSNQGSRDFDISGLAGLSPIDYDHLQPIQWPVNDENPYGTKRMFTTHQFFTATQKANFIPIIPRSPLEQVSDSYPFILNSGRVRDQWHTMTRTGKAAQLSGHRAYAQLSMHPVDANLLDLSNGDLVRIDSANTLVTMKQPRLANQKGLGTTELGTHNAVVLPITIDENQRRGELFAPIHWNGTNSSSSAIAGLYPDSRDPISGQPELKHVPVGLEKISFDFVGKIFSKYPLSTELLNTLFEHWISGPLSNGMWIEYATNTFLDTSSLQPHFPTIDEWLSSQQNKDGSPTTQRILAIEKGGLSISVFSAEAQSLISREWIEKLFLQTELEDQYKSALLRGEMDPEYANGRLICSCFNVRETQINDAINSGVTTVEALGSKLNCGTNCGSCRPELQQLIGRVQTDMEPQELNSLNKLSSAYT